jgi:hypothetical protein
VPGPDGAAWQRGTPRSPAPGREVCCIEFHVVTKCNGQKTVKLEIQRELFGLPSQKVAGHGCPSCLVPLIPKKTSLLQLGIITGPSMLCIVLAACVGELFDLSGVMGLQPTVQSRWADIMVILCSCSRAGLWWVTFRHPPGGCLHCWGRCAYPQVCGRCPGRLQAACVSAGVLRPALCWGNASCVGRAHTSLRVPLAGPRYAISPGPRLRFF